MEEESLVDMLHDMHKLMKSQKEDIKILNMKIDIMGAKVNKTLFPELAGEPPEPLEPPKPPIDNSHLYQPNEVAPLPPKQAIVPKTQKNIRVFGHFEGQDSKPLSGVNISILNSSDVEVKKTKSNRAGLWSSFLPPGEYSIEFGMPGMMSEFRVFTLLEGQKEKEIS